MIGSVNSNTQVGSVRFRRRLNAVDGIFIGFDKRTTCECVRVNFLALCVHIYGILLATEYNSNSRKPRLRLPQYEKSTPSSANGMKGNNQNIICMNVYIF